MRAKKYHLVLYSSFSCLCTESVFHHQHTQNSILKEKKKKFVNSSRKYYQEHCVFYFGYTISVFLLSFVHHLFAYFSQILHPEKINKMKRINKWMIKRKICEKRALKCERKNNIDKLQYPKFNEGPGNMWMRIYVCVHVWLKLRYFGK